jgi:hypothetical protein
MQTALASRDFTAVFVLLLEATGVSQQQLGAWVGVGQPVVSKIKHGQWRVDTFEVIQRIADGLAMPPHARRLLGLLADPDTPARAAVAFGDGAGPAAGGGAAADADPGRELALWWAPGGMPTVLEGTIMIVERRRFLELTGGALAGAAHQWMVADPARIAAALDGARVDAAAVDDLERVLDVRRRQDDLLGGGAVYDAVAADLRLTVDLLRHSSYTEAVGGRLYGVAAEQARLAGWAAFDAGNAGLAQRLWLVGLRAAHEAGDLAVGANVLCCMAEQATAGNDPRGAVTLLRTAYAHAAGAMTATEKAALAVELAHAHAAAGDPGAAAGEIEAAFAWLDRARPEEDPPYIYWCTRANVSYTAGKALVRDEPRRAIPYLEDAVSDLAASNRRSSVTCILALATAHARDGRPEHAAHLGHQAVDPAFAVDSARVRRGFAELAREIEAAGHPAADLREHAGVLRA